MNSKFSLEEIKGRVEELASKIDAPDNTMPTYASIRGDATPCIEVDNSGFMYFVISERGEEYERRVTQNIDDLLYWIFAGVTFSMAIKYELRHRVEDKDSRRIMFQKQEELLGILNENWKQREANDHENILKSYPFDDLAGLRADFCGKLRGEGFSESEINKLAYAKYPR